MAFPTSPEVLAPSAAGLVVVTVVLFLLVARVGRRSEPVEPPAAPAAPPQDERPSAGLWDEPRRSSTEQQDGSEGSPVDPSSPTGPAGARTAPAVPPLPVREPGRQTPPPQPGARSAAHLAPALPWPRPRTEPAPPPGHDARDKLLAVLLPDPSQAVRAVAELEDSRTQLDLLTDAVGHHRHLLGLAANRLLRAGLTPSQVAALAGMGEDELADLVAATLGLLDDQPTGSSRTADPGRAWASAGSAAGSTTPTTG